MIQPGCCDSPSLRVASILPQFVQSRSKPFGGRLNNTSCFAVTDKFQRTSGIDTSNQWFGCEHCLERYVTVILVNWGIDHADTSRILVAFFCLAYFAQKFDPISQFKTSDLRFQPLFKSGLVCG